MEVKYLLWTTTFFFLHYLGVRNVSVQVLKKHTHSKKLKDILPVRWYHKILQVYDKFVVELTSDIFESETFIELINCKFHLREYNQRYKIISSMNVYIARDRHFGTIIETIVSWSIKRNKKSKRTSWSRMSRRFKWKAFNHFKNDL